MTAHQLLNLLRTLPDEARDLPVVMQGPVVREVADIDLHYTPGGGHALKLIGARNGQN